MRSFGRTLLALGCAALVAGGFAAAGEELDDAAAIQAVLAADTADADFGESLEPQRIIVEATRIGTPIENVAGSVSVTTAEQAEARQYRTAADVLRTMPGITLRQQGGIGTKASVFMRGLDSKYSRFMMDGMPIYDASDPNAAFDFSGLTLDNLGQLEVLQGSQSMLYGSMGAAGLVNFVSARGTGPLSGFFSTEAGSRGTVLGRFGASAGNEKGDFSISGSATHTDGFNITDVPGASERDGYWQGNMAMRLGFNPTDGLRFDLFARGQVSESELDNMGEDWPFFKTRKESFMIRPQMTLSLFDGRWEQKVGFGYSEYTRKNKDDLSAAWPQRNKYRGVTTKFDYQSIFRVHETNTILAGVDVVTDYYKVQDVYYGPGRTPTRKFGSITTTGVFLEDQINISDVFIATAGIRAEFNDEFEDKVTWRSAARYNFSSGTTLKGSIGTGFRAPSLYERYGDGGIWVQPAEDLKPETFVSWDLGFEQALYEERVKFGATFFHNKVKNLVEYNWGGWYYNVGEAKTWGVESFLAFAITDNLTLTGNYTWLRAIDNETDQTLLRRPKHEASLNLEWRFLGKGLLVPGIHHVGKRKDSDLSSRRVTLPSYTTARVAVSWKFSDRLEVFGRVENLFDKKYSDVAGYRSERLGVFAGAKISF